MDGEVLALVLAVGVPLFLRLLDYVLPKGRHFSMVGRYSRADHDDEMEEDPDVA